MGKYSISATKEDYNKMYEKLRELESKMNGNWKGDKIKRSSLDQLEVLYSATKRRIESPDYELIKTS